MTPTERRARKARKALDFDMNYGTVTGRVAQPGPDPWQLPRSRQPLWAMQLRAEAAKHLPGLSITNVTGRVSQFRPTFQYLTRGSGKSRLYKELQLAAYNHLAPKPLVFYDDLGDLELRLDYISRDNIWRLPYFTLGDPVSQPIYDQVFKPEHDIYALLVKWTQCILVFDTDTGTIIGVQPPNIRQQIKVLEAHQQHSFVDPAS